MKEPPTGSPGFRKLNSHLFPRTDSHIHTGPAVEREADLHDEIEAWCKERGYYYIHSRMDKRTTNAKGTPDFFVFMHKCVLAVECKAKNNKPTKEQIETQAHLRKLGHTCEIIHNMQGFNMAVAEAAFNSTVI